MSRIVELFLVTLVIMALPGLAPANLVWSTSVGCSVYDGVNEDVVVYDDIESPFVGSHAAQLGDLQAAAAYDFRWDSFAGQFLVNALQTGPNTSEYSYSTCGGFIGLTSSFALDTSMSVSYDFILPGSTTEAVLEMTVGRIELPGPGFVVIWSESDGVVAGSDPLSGALSIAESMILPAGQMYVVSYAMTLYVDGGGTADLQPLFGDGVVKVQFAKVPEPSALMLMCFSITIFGRRASGSRSMPRPAPQEYLPSAA